MKLKPISSILFGLTFLLAASCNTSGDNATVKATVNSSQSSNGEATTDVHFKNDNYAVTIGKAGDNFVHGEIMVSGKEVPLTDAGYNHPITGMPPRCICHFYHGNDGSSDYVVIVEDQNDATVEKYVGRKIVGSAQTLEMVSPED